MMMKMAEKIVEKKTLNLTVLESVLFCTLVMMYDTTEWRTMFQDLAAEHYRLTHAARCSGEFFYFQDTNKNR